MTGVAILLAYSAFASMCLAMNRHHRQVWQVEPAGVRRVLLRGSGWVLLIASYAVCLLKRGWAIGLVDWCAALSAAALILIFLLPYRPRLAALLGMSALLLVIIFWLAE